MHKRHIPFIGLLALILLLTGGLAAAQSRTTYYVGRINCDNAGADSGSSAVQPFCSFDEALRVLQPGDTLMILYGTYTDRLVIEGLEGTADAPIIVRSAGAAFDGGCTSFPCSLREANWDADAWGLDGFVTIRSSRHVILRDMVVRNVVGEGVRVENSENVTVANVRVEGAGNAGIIALYSQDITITDSRLRGVQLGYIDWDGDPHFGAHEALSVVGVAGFTVVGNTLSTVLKEGIDIREGSSNGMVYGNRIENTCLVGININEARDVDVYLNTIRGTGYRVIGGAPRPCDGDPIFGPMMGAYYGTGIMLAVGDLGELANIVIYQNVITGSRGDCIQFWDELRASGRGAGRMTGSRIYNNVLHTCGLAGIRLDDAEDTFIANNIIALNAGGTIVGNALAASTITHNLYQMSQDDHEAVGSDAVIGDPLFANPGDADFHLQSASPAIDQGMDTGLPYFGSAPDIGAFEFSG